MSIEVSSSDCASCRRVEEYAIGIYDIQLKVGLYTHLTRLHLAAKDAHKLGQVLEVSRHLGGQYHVDNGAARRFVGLLVEVLEYVNLVIACRAHNTKTTQ